MNKHQVYLCQKHNGEFEPRYVELVQKEIEKYKQCIKATLSFEDYEELVECEVKDESAMVESLFFKKVVGKK